MFLLPLFRIILYQAIPTVFFLDIWLFPSIRTFVSCAIPFFSQLRLTCFQFGLFLEHLCALKHLLTETTFMNVFTFSSYLPLDQVKLNRSYWAPTCLDITGGNFPLRNVFVTFFLDVKISWLCRFCTPRFLWRGHDLFLLLLFHLLLHHPLLLTVVVVVVMILLFCSAY